MGKFYPKKIIDFPKNICYTSRIGKDLSDIFKSTLPDYSPVCTNSYPSASPKNPLRESSKNSALFPDFRPKYGALFFSESLFSSFPVSKSPQKYILISQFLPENLYHPDNYFQPPRLHHFSQVSKIVRELRKMSKSWKNVKPQQQPRAGHTKKEPAKPGRLPFSVVCFGADFTALHCLCIVRGSVAALYLRIFVSVYLLRLRIYCAAVSLLTSECVGASVGLTGLTRGICRESESS